jgi:cell wall-associated NlpC family hydrolase
MTPERIRLDTASPGGNARQLIASPHVLGSRARPGESTGVARPTRSPATTATFRLPASSEVAASGAVGASVLAAGGRYLGTRYEMGGGRAAGAVRSIDCSAFVSRAYSDATAGRIKLTPYTDAMYAETVAVSPASAGPGDLVFYRGNDSSQPGTQYPHVALYSGQGRVLDASSSVGAVSYRPMGLGPNYTPEFRRVKGA